MHGLIFGNIFPGHTLEILAIFITGSYSKKKKKFSASDVPPVKSEGIYCAF